MRMSLTLAALLLLAGGVGVLAAPAPPEKPKEESGPMEIDFAPLPSMDGRAKYKIHVVAKVDGEEPYKDTYTVSGSFEASQIRDFARDSFKSTEWTVRADGRTKLIVEGYKGKPLKGLELKTEGLAKEQTPTVRRVTAKEK